MISRFAVFLFLYVGFSSFSVFAADLLHRYSFADGASDGIGSADGELENGAFVSGGELVLDGGGGYVDLPNGLFTGLDDITVEAWLTDNGSGVWSRIYDFGSSSAGEGSAGTGTQYMFLTPQAGDGAMRGAYTITGGGGGEQIVLWSNNRLPLGVQTHVVWTSDSASNTGRLYVDGEMVGENPNVTLRPSDLEPTVNNWIGRSQWNGDPPLNANIAEFRIYDGALTVEEVQDNYEFGPEVLALGGPVEFVEEPASRTVDELASVTFEVLYSGEPPVSVQWFRDSVPIPGATEDRYTLASATVADHGASFHVVISNQVSGTPHTAISGTAVLSVTPDLIAPGLIRASSQFPDGVRVQFSEGVSEETATDAANYVITYAGGSLAVTSAQIGTEDPSIVVLGTAEQTLERLYTLTVNNVTDLSDAANEIAAGSQVTFVAVPYLTDDIGSPATGGVLSTAPGGFDLTAGGGGIEGSADQFTFSHKAYTGDFDVQVRLAGLDFSGPWALAGLMARDGTEDDARFAGAFAAAGPAGSHFASRGVIGAAASMQGAFPAGFPGAWLRLRRTGNLFEGFAGLDGMMWQPLGSTTIAMPASIEVGMAVTAGDDSAATTAQFRDESIGGGTVVQNLELPFEPMGPSSRRTALVISEIMYETPAAWGGDDTLEYIEIWNSGLVTEDLTGHRFSGEIDYEFPDGTLLAPGEFLVVAREPVAAQAFYGVPFLGPYPTRLDNAGGTLRLRNELDGILLEIEYENRDPWPVAAAGTGHSLVLSHPSYGENDPRAWSASDAIGGSPGAVEPYGSEPARGVVINEFLAHTDEPDVDYIELFNTGTQPVDLSGAWLSDEAGSAKVRIADGTTIPGKGFLVFDQNQLGFALSADGEEVVLVNSNQTRVLDAVSFDGQANGVSSGRYPDGAPGIRELAVSTPGGINAPPLVRPVVINEIMYHPISGEDDDEYLELYNRSAAPIDLSGWRIEDGVGFQFPAGSVIAGNGYVVVAKNRAHLVAKYPQLTAGNTFGDYDGVLSNGGERIAVSMPEQQIGTNSQGALVTNIYTIVVDEVVYVDGGRWGAWSDGGGSSLELIDPDADNRLAANWADSDETGKAAWTSIDVTVPLVNGQTFGTVDEGGFNGQPNRFEMFLQGAGEALVDNVEFRNNGGANLVGNGTFSSGTEDWTLGGVVRESFAEGGVGIGGSTALHMVAAGRGDTGPNKAWSSLSSTASTGASDTGTMRAQVRWLRGDNTILLRLRGNWMEVSQRLNVPTDCGTPGLPNSGLVANAGPAIHEVSHTPILPAANQAVVVSARVVDPDGIGVVNLRYRVDPSTSYASLIMRDDGAGGDPVAGDGLYSATLPGRDEGDLVAFHVAASDGLGAATQFPAAAPERECLVRWGETVLPGSVGTYRLWLTQANIDFWTNRERNANDTIDATFVYGNYRAVYNVGTMYSGSPFHTPAYNGPLANIACDYEVNFRPDDRLLGSEPFVLTAYDIFDPNFFFNDDSAQVDQTGTWIGRKLGQQYNYRRHMHMIVNGQQRGSIYDDTQQPNADMLDQYYPDDSQEELRKIESWFEFQNNGQTQGSTYARIGRVNLPSGEIDTKWYRWTWRPRSTRDPDNWFAFTNLVAAVNDTGAADYEARVRTWMDVRNFLRPIAVHRIAGSWDSYAYDRGKNMYAYKPDGRGWLLQLWDIELSLGAGGNGPTDDIYRTEDPILFNMITSVPAFHREYLQAFQEAVDTALAPGVADVWLDERFGNLRRNGVGVQSPEFIKNYMSQRRSYLVGILPTADFDVDNPASSSSAANSVVLTGTSPLQVYEIRVNGIAYPVEWTGTTTWRVVVPLAVGVNTLEVTGVDRLGNAVAGASTSRTVTYTGGAVDPAGWVVINEIHPSPEAEGRQFVEIVNRHSNYTFDLSDWRFNGLGYTFPVGSLLAPGQYRLLVQDPFEFAAANPSAVIHDVYGGRVHPDGETLTIFRPGALPGEEIVVDRVRYEPAAPWADATQGKSLQLVDATRDNSRVANWESTEEEPAGPPQQAVAMDAAWRYYQAGDPGASWRDPAYDDSSWPSGPALLYVEDANLPAPKNTPLTLGQVTYYFRTTFTYTGVVAGAMLDLSTVVDDGIVLYLNGQEVFRLGMDPGPVGHNTLAGRVVGEAEIEGPFLISGPALQSGENVLAAEVHQQGAGSSDIVFGLTLDVIPGPTTAATPGAPNTVARTLPPFPEVWLNELQAENLSGLQDNAGERDPWVEIYNAGSAPLSLEGYFLTDDYGALQKWAFPAGASVPAGGFLVVWCDGQPGQSAGSDLHTSFELAPTAGQAALTRLVAGAPQVVDYLNYAELPADWSYGDVPDGQPFYRQAMYFATPEAQNNGASPPITVFINEWLADNESALVDPADGDYDDWFEIYNPGTDPVDLGGYFLTDDLSDPFQFEIPDTGQYTIPPGGFLLVWADNAPEQNAPDRSDLHVNFALSRNGESIGLFGQAGTAIDAVTFGEQTADVTQGRFPDGADSILVLTAPTPRASNVVGNTPPVLEPIADRVAAPGQSVHFTAVATDADLPPQALTFSLASAPPGATIHPTTGAFNWTPLIAPANHDIAVMVTDNGTPNRSATQGFTVTVVDETAVAELGLDGDELSIQWLSVSGRSYQVLYKDDLLEVNWQPIGDLRIGTGGFMSFTDSVSESPQRYFTVDPLP